MRSRGAVVIEAWQDPDLGRAHLYHALEKVARTTGRRIWGFQTDQIIR